LRGASHADPSGLFCVNPMMEERRASRRVQLAGPRTSVGCDTCGAERRAMISSALERGGAANTLDNVEGTERAVRRWRPALLDGE